MQVHQSDLQDMAQMSATYGVHHEEFSRMNLPSYLPAYLYLLKVYSHNITTVL